MRTYVAFSRYPTRGHIAFFIATHVKYFQGYIGRDAISMSEEPNYLPTHLAREWCDTQLEDA